MEILALSRHFPFPPTQGSSRRLSAVLAALSDQHNVSLLSFTKNLSLSVKHVADAPGSLRRVKVLETKSPERYLRAAGALLSGGTPLGCSTYLSSGMIKEVRHALQSTTFDGAYVFDIKMAPYIRYLPPMKVFVDLDISYSRYYSRQAELEGSARRLLYTFESRRMKKYEESVIRAATLCFICSDREKELFPRHHHEKIHVLRNVIDIGEFPCRTSSPDTRDILFTGRFSYGPNVEGVLFFVEEVFPLVLEKHPDARLWLVGSNPAAEVERLGRRSEIVVTGFVPSIKPYLERAKVFVCPSRYGGGTRLKILEAMAGGVPIVSTAIGCEGIEVENNVHVLIADTPAAFAEAVCSLLSDSVDASALCREARTLVENRYGLGSLNLPDLSAHHDTD